MRRACPKPWAWRAQWAIQTERKPSFAMIVRSDLKGLGLGKLMFEQLIAHARSRGIGRLVGLVLRENTRMLNLSRTMGFKADPIEPDSSGVRRMVKTLDDSGGA